MYQKIDDIDAKAQDLDHDAPHTGHRRARVWLIAFVILGFSIMLMAAVWKHSQKPAEHIHPSNQAEAVSVFNRIQAEPRNAIRRARLIDYTQTYTDSPVINGARQQLRVMNEYEAADWAALSDIMFAGQVNAQDQQIAVNQYIAKWGEGLVGTRDADIKSFKAELGKFDQNAQRSRRHTPEPSPIPTSVNGAQLAGGQSLRPIVPSYPAPQPVTPQAPIITRTPVIVPLQIRRASRPNYPRRAYSRGVPARVEVSFNVDAKGRVQLVKIVDVQAARYEKDFSYAARRAARNTRYTPKTIDGEPVAVTDIRKTYVFDPEVR